MEFIDARRLTGPNLLGELPGTVLDIACESAEIDQVVSVWLDALRTAHQALGWRDCRTSFCALSGGVSLYFTAAIDSLYGATAINEWAWQCIAADATGEASPAFVRSAIDKVLAEETNSSLLMLQQAAANNHTTFLWDDDDVSLGLGAGCRSWAAIDLPDRKSIDFSQFSDVPVGIVTGTNGKTTCARLAKFILEGSGKSVGVSCTDWIAVNDRIIDRGDWSGPGGARRVLRDKSVQCAILETARGGLLRRGLGVERAEAALITNIAEDHLGDFGSRSLVELLNVKWIVSRVVESHGSLVLNADDPLLVQKARDFSGRIVWFSLDAGSPVITSHIQRGGRAFVVDQQQLVRLSGGERTVICSVADIPITLQGAATHNIANALAAAALTHEMDAGLTAIRAGLNGMTQRDNPGRCNLYAIDGFSVLVDFAHNPHAINALFEMARSLPAKRRLLAFGQAGDRPDSLIRDLSRAVSKIGLDRILISELQMYYRGRRHGEVFAVIRDELLANGTADNAIDHFETEPEALAAAIAWAQPGDLIIMLALGERDAIQTALEELSQQKA